MKVDSAKVKRGAAADVGPQRAGSGKLSLGARIRRIRLRIVAQRRESFRRFQLSKTTG